MPVKIHEFKRPWPEVKVRLNGELVDCAAYAWTVDRLFVRVKMRPMEFSRFDGHIIIQGGSNRSTMLDRDSLVGVNRHIDSLTREMIEPRDRRSAFVLITVEPTTSTIVIDGGGTELRLMCTMNSNAERAARQLEGIIAFAEEQARSAARRGIKREKLDGLRKAR